AVVDQGGAQPVHLLIARYIGKFRQLLHTFDHARRKGIQLGGIGILERVLELRPADAILHGEILYWLHKEWDGLDLGEHGLQSADHIAGADLALLQRFQSDEDPSAVESQIGAIDTDKG